LELHGKVAVVTGSATGIGAATATLLAEKGCNVVVNYTRSEKEAKETATACAAAGAEAHLCRADVSDDGDCRRLVGAALERWGRLDVLVNNAGATKFADPRNLDALDFDDFQRVHAVNLVGAYQMIRAAAPHMREAGAGAIVNVSSIAGVMGVGSSIAYATSKGALNTLTLCLARTLAPEIRVNAVCPGFVQTRWMREGLGEKYEQRLARFEEMVPLGSATTAEQVAKSIVFFIADADHVTGEFLIMDSGLHLGHAPLKAR
jgi:3-oxoacyl-[acyl-carrier protein] reductase